MFGGLGVPELLIIFLVVLLLFGANRIPEIARGMGKGIREFKDATSDIQREITQDENQPRINRPQQGAPAARNQAAEQEPAPQEPARADNPGDVDQKKQKAS